MQLSTGLRLLLLSLLLALPLASVTAPPASARFLQPDTLDPLMQGVDINRYAYGANDPINNSDPNGHFFQEIKDFFSKPHDRDAQNQSIANDYDAELRWNEENHRNGKIPDVIYEDRKLELTKLRDYYSSLVGQTDTDIGIRIGQKGLEIGSFGGARPILGALSQLGSKLKRGKDVVTLYRSVSRAEAKQIMKTGKLEAGSGAMEGKWMAETLEDARKWGAKMDPAKDTTIVEIKLPKSVADSLYRDPRLDGIGPARYGEIDQLGGATLRILGP